MHLTLRPFLFQEPVEHLNKLHISLKRAIILLCFQRGVNSQKFLTCKTFTLRMLTIFNGSYKKKFKIEYLIRFSYAECYLVVLKLVLPSMQAPAGLLELTGEEIWVWYLNSTLFSCPCISSVLTVAQVPGWVPSIITIPTTRSSQMRGSDLQFHTKQELNVMRSLLAASKTNFLLFWHIHHTLIYSLRSPSTSQQCALQLWICLDGTKLFCRLQPCFPRSPSVTHFHCHSWQN